MTQAGIKHVLSCRFVTPESLNYTFSGSMKKSPLLKKYDNNCNSTFWCINLHEEWTGCSKTINQFKARFHLWCSWFIRHCACQNNWFMIDTCWECCYLSTYLYMCVCVGGLDMTDIWWTRLFGVNVTNGTHDLHRRRMFIQIEELVGRVSSTSDNFCLHFLQTREVPTQTDLHTMAAYKSVDSKRELWRSLWLCVIWYYLKQSCICTCKYLLVHNHTA